MANPLFVFPIPTGAEEIFSAMRLPMALPPPHSRSIIGPTTSGRTVFRDHAFERALQRYVSVILQVFVACPGSADANAVT